VDPALIFSSTTNNDINACSIVLFVITERWPGARKYRNTFEVVKQNVIDAIAEGRHQGPRQPVIKLKTGLQSTLHNMQGDEDQQNECSRILTDMSGERIAVEQATLLPVESVEADSAFGSWQPRPGYGIFSPQVTSMSPYNELTFGGNVAGGMKTTQAHFQTSDLFSDDFDVGHFSKFPGWR
jgi:hypothetical protein